MKWFVIEDGRQHEVALHWDPKMRKRAPRAYINRCQNAVIMLDESVPWHKLRKDRVKSSLNVTIRCLEES